MHYRTTKCSRTYTCLHIRGHPLRTIIILRQGVTSPHTTFLLHLLCKWDCHILIWDLRFLLIPCILFHLGIHTTMLYLRNGKFGLLSGCTKIWIFIWSILPFLFRLCKHRLHFCMDSLFQGILIQSTHTIFMGQFICIGFLHLGVVKYFLAKEGTCPLLLQTIQN